jgi:hypothetical protein
MPLETDTRRFCEGGFSNSAHVAELVDAHGSGPCAVRCGGSSPSVGTIYYYNKAQISFVLRKLLPFEVHQSFRLRLK